MKLLTMSCSVGCFALLQGVSELLVPQAHLINLQHHAFSFVSPSIWNDLPLELHPSLVVHLLKFYTFLKSLLSSVVAELGALLSGFLKGAI